MQPSADADRRAASNANTPLERLEELAGPWPEEVATNLVWSQRAADDPEWLDNVELRTLWALCASPTAARKLDGDRLVDRMNGHDDVARLAILFAYWGNPTRSKAVRWKDFQGLTVDDLTFFRDRFAVHPDPDPVVGLLVRAGLAWRGAGPFLDAAGLAALGKRKALTWLLVRQPNCPVELLLKHADDELVALHNARFPVEQLIVLSRSPESAVRSTVAMHPSLPLEQVTTLAHDENAFVRQAVARRDGLPEALAKMLANDPVEWVREAKPSHDDVARLRGDWSPVFEPLLDDSALHVHAAANPTLPPHVARALAANETASVQAALTSNPALPTDVLDSWLAGTLEQRLLAASARALTPAQVEKLVGDPVANVRSAVLRNPLLTVAQRASLERDPDEDVRYEWARAAQSEPEMLRVIEALPDDSEHLDQLADLMLTDWKWVPPAVAIAVAQRRNPVLDGLMKEQIDLCPEAWRVMLYGP